MNRPLSQQDYDLPEDWRGVAIERGKFRSFPRLTRVGTEVVL